MTEGPVISLAVSKGFPSATQGHLHCFLRGPCTLEAAVVRPVLATLCASLVHPPPARENSLLLRARVFCLKVNSLIQDNTTTGVATPTGRRFTRLQESKRRGAGKNRSPLSVPVDTCGQHGAGKAAGPGHLEGHFFLQWNP